MTENPAVIAFRDYLTESQEYSQFYNSNGYPSTSLLGSEGAPFYADGSNGNTQINFGYGYNLTVNDSSLILDAVNAANLAGANINVTLVTSLIDQVDNLTEQSWASTTSANQALAAINQQMPKIDWRGIAQTVMDGYYSEDTAGYAGGNNLYAYVGNDPINLTDPWGLWGITISGGGLAEVGLSSVFAQAGLQGAGTLARIIHQAS